MTSVQQAAADVHDAGTEKPSVDAAPSAAPIVPRGYLGNLDETQQHAFDQFKREVTETLGPCEGTWHDDATLIRFLRARRFSPPKALKQLTDTAAWRKSIDIDELFANFDGEELHGARKHYPRWSGRRDRLGRPVYVYRLASLDKKRQADIAAVPPERETQRLAVLSEIMIRFMQGMCTHLAQEKQAHDKVNGHSRPIAPMSEVTSIIDFEGAGLGQMWALRNHLKQATLLASAHYPETLGTMALVNVPRAFSVVWGWIQSWFDEVSRNKMFVIGNNEDAASRRAKLTKIIAPEDLSVAYGGTLQWTYDDEPALDDDVKRAIGRDTLPNGPIEWVNGGMRIVNGNADEKAQPVANGDAIAHEPETNEAETVGSHDA